MHNKMDNLVSNIKYSIQRFAALTEQTRLYYPQHHYRGHPYQNKHHPQEGQDGSLNQSPFQETPSYDTNMYAPFPIQESTTQSHPNTDNVKTYKKHKQSKANGRDTPTRVIRPPNGYLLFNKEMRKKLKEENPAMKVAEISKEISHQWKTISKEQKDRYLNEAGKLKELQRELYPNMMYIRRSRAELVKDGYLPRNKNKKYKITEDYHEGEQLGDIKDIYPDRYPANTQIKRKRRRDKNSLVPKHPLCAYMWYLTEERPDTLKNNPGMSVGQVSKICADRWNNMSDEARSPWRKQAQMDKERYAKEMQIYSIKNEHILGRGTKQKYRSATATLTMDSDLYYHKEQHLLLSHRTTSPSIPQNVLPIVSHTQDITHPNVLLPSPCLSKTDQYTNN